ncbi:MAG: hypothetical protein Ta2G_05940 [Termitinemataceae bacterium]|nr:MAG: hypothetical protein Ta2G_05940 [Termitinemataceae bacterium]
MNSDLRERKYPLPYIPNLGIKYPEKTYEHMPLRPKIRDIKFDGNYPYYDKSFKFRFISFMVHALIFTFYQVIQIIRFDLKIEGRSNLRKYKQMFKNGALTISNHIMRMDFVCVLYAVRRRLHFPALAYNMCTKDAGFIRAVGGIPIPAGFDAMRAFNAAFDRLHSEKAWFHSFPEASSWDYNQSIRPFRKGTFTLAYRYNIPVIPMAFSYREPTGIYRLFKKGQPLITLRIGEPIIPNLNLRRKEAVNILREQCHKKIVELAGMLEGENPYPCAID